MIVVHRAGRHSRSRLRGRSLRLEHTMTAPVFPPGRYGRRREPHRAPRWVLPVLVVLVLLAGLAVAATLYRRQAVQVRGAVVAFDVAAEDRVRVRFTVRGARSAAATCTVRARAADGAEVGRAEVPVPAGGDRDPTVTYDLRTSRRAVTGEVQRCARAPSR